MTSRALRIPIAVLALAVIAVSTLPAAGALTTQRVASGLRYPIYVTAPPADDRLFIVDQRGVIRILRNSQVLARPFLDIDALIPNISGQDERGLLGLAFDPSYRTNGYIYLNYTNLSSDTIIARYTVSSDPDSVDPATAYQIMFIDQPFSNHNGGHLAFGPDGYLYIGMGDGGSGGDPNNNGQSDATLLGKMLRIDIRSDDFPGDPAKNYAIPPTNPYAAPGLPLDEIWAKGMRNPYRWSFDSATGDIYIADVGQNAWEEVDFEPAGFAGGRNYGWRLMEGNHCYNPPNNCDPGGLTYPIHEYSHSFGCSITGGYVYRGSFIPGLAGTYFFADFCTSSIWSFRYVGGQVTEFTNRTAELAPGGGLFIGSIAGFGEDGQGEMYICDRGVGTDGEVYKIRTTDNSGVGGSDAPRVAFSLSPASPNPFATATRFGVDLVRPGRLTVDIYDASGRLVRNLESATARGAGPLSLVWDGVDGAGAQSPSGVYFLRAEVDGQALTQRLGLVR